MHCTSAQTMEARRRGLWHFIYWYLIYIFTKFYTFLSSRSFVFNSTNLLCFYFWHCSWLFHSDLSSSTSLCCTRRAAQLKKPPPVTVDGAWGLSPDNRRRLCISSCYLVGFNRVMIKTMWLSTAIDVWKDIFSFSELNSCIALFFTVFLGICVQQTVAYNSHIVPDRSWMAISEIGILSSLFISLIVSKFLLNFRCYALALFLYSYSSNFLYISCMINANVTNMYATKYAICSDSNFDQAAISITQTILQNCLGKVLAPILATIFWDSFGFFGYSLFNFALATSTVIFSNVFIIGSINSN
mmetsp:Transcript_2602/g.4142  ORF Transcript_2602/g.4142 Transcript_2602/m.4142 type:complete len:300 (-) Transcript_2602:181-1080(-)